ncbi:MAG: protein-disulfide reductase DsbD N-terminal domain-containing protein [Gammaproteobacteria bacterium]|nr:protein-disulfide reductase DsbD N-terminal domain-containing protein [Gammaproteobacteria bacterium]
MRISVSLSLGLLLCLVIPYSHAQLNKKEDILSVDEAFKLNMKLDHESIIRAEWNIEEGHYLYQHAFEVFLEDSILYQQKQLPKGITKSDVEFGEVVVYYDSIELEVELEKMPSDLRIGVKYQGCAEGRLCYPPTVKWFTLRNRVFYPDDPDSSN